MKKTIKLTAIVATAFVLALTSCKEDEKKPAPSNPPAPTPDPQELITTFKLILTDSATNAEMVYMFKDPDGEGGLPAYYGPSSTSQTDSVIQLLTNTTYYGEIILLDESKNVPDTISHEVEEEGAEHMFFYNHGANTILNAANPYTVLLNGSGIRITYTDLDAGTPQRGIGLKTKWRTAAGSGSAKHNLNVTLKHQPDQKDGTYAPGESDISVDFKILIN
jgi:hypothetical protein